MTIFIEKQFEANLKSNVELIELCGTLTDEQLAVEVEGIYGNIKSLIIHTIQAEGNYLRDLAGSNPWAADIDWENLLMAELAEKAKQSGTALCEHAPQFDPNQMIHFEDDEEIAEFRGWVVINQAIYHGIEHRIQIHALLTKIGVSHPRQDGWGFASSIGELKIVEKS